MKKSLIGIFVACAASVCMTGCKTQLAETPEIQKSSVENVNNVLCFENAASFVEMLNAAEKTGLEVRSVISSRAVAGEDFVSMMDVVLNSDEIESEEALNEFISEYPKVLVDSDYIDSEGENVTVYNLAVAPQLATLVNPEGLVLVGGTVYNVLDEGEFEKLSNVCKNTQTERSVFTVYDGLPTSIPLAHGVTAGPQYSVKDFTTEINGREVVVQLWKGYCPLVGGSGGVGAEIGLYNKVNFSKKIWMPDFKHCVNMSYSLIYKKKGTIYLTRSGYTWWLNGWRIFELAPSIWGNNYTLKYTINGITRSW